MINVKHFAAVVGCVGLFFIMSSDAAEQFGTGVFPNTSVIEQQLKRGTSNKADVQRLLGVPNGTGNLSTPPGNLGVQALGDGPREIWYYDDMEVTDMKSGDGVITMNMRQQILLVFFKGEVFDGYFWTSNKYAPTAK
jgi:hypothetical protein